MPKGVGVRVPSSAPDQRVRIPGPTSPSTTASMSALQPRSLTWSSSAPASIRRRATSTWPRWAAAISAVPSHGLVVSALQRVHVSTGFRAAGGDGRARILPLPPADAARHLDRSGAVAAGARARPRKRAEERALPHRGLARPRRIVRLPRRRRIMALLDAPWMSIYLFFAYCFIRCSACSRSAARQSSVAWRSPTMR